MFGLFVESGFLLAFMSLVNYSFFVFLIFILKAAQCVFEKLGVEENGRITLQELLEFIRSGGSWSKLPRNQHMELESTQKNVSMDFIEPSSLG